MHLRFYQSKDLIHQMNTNINTNTNISTRRKYDTISQILHHFMAIGILIMIGIGLVFMFYKLSNDTRHFWMHIHKSLGLTLLLLIILRIIWRFIGMKKPVYPQTFQKSHIILANITAFFLYASMLFMLLSGYLGSSLYGAKVPFWWIKNVALPLPTHKIIAEYLFDIHAVCVWFLISFIILHILGNIFHLLRKDKILQRMF